MSNAANYGFILTALQYTENYGTPEAPYWKFKGGETVKTASAVPLELLTPEVVAAFEADVNSNPRHVWRNDMSEQYVLVSTVVAADRLQFIDSAGLDQHYFGSDALKDWDYNGSVVNNGAAPGAEQMYILIKKEVADPALDAREAFARELVRA